MRPGEDEPPEPGARAAGPAEGVLRVCVVGGITAWDTATISAGKAVRQAWARCMVRSELDAIAAAPDNSSGYASPDPNVGVSVSGVGRSGEQQVTVVARDPQSQMLLFQASILKATALAGTKNIATEPQILTDIQYGCPAP